MSQRYAAKHARICARKLTYVTRERAQQALGTILEAGVPEDKPLMVYQCANCWYFHLGHAPYRVRQRA